MISFEKSFASHEKAQYWSNKNVSKPEAPNREFMSTDQSKRLMTLPDVPTSVQT